ncbi:hypothetical protein DPMN_110719 [Dreissena polymorpha]|uniref:Uncharacterized protein n=1 Tax=Dreissena polymorpha TaxID=45954 RepID=A0A9D4KD42_DREPO|nr:hypothetical protein DPMN_110719 [Dreissena polymorpha]
MSVFKRGGPDTDGHEIAVTQRNGEFSLEMNQTSETPTGSEPLSLDSHTENRKFCQPAGVFSGPSNPTAIRWRNKNQFHPPADQMVNNKASHKVKHPLEKVDTTQAMISNAYPTHAVQYSLQFRNGFGQRQLYPWEQQRSAGSGHVTNSTLFYNWPENNEHSRYRAPGSNGNAMTTFSENNVPLDETRVSFSSQPSANAYGFCNNNDFLNANSQIQTAVDDIIQYPTQNELGITRRQGELAFTANMLDLDNRKSWRGFSSLNAFPDMDTLIPDYKRTISDDGWVAAAYPGQRTQDNLEQIISPETCRRSQSRSPYSPEMIQMLIDQVVETNNSKKVIQEIKKITDPIKDQDIVENIVSKLQEATLKRKYSCDKPTVSTNNSNDTADNEMGTYNGHTCPESATSSPETELRGAPACGPKDNCVMLIADSDAAYERFPDIVDRHNLNTAKVLATFGEIRLGMAILDREKADHRQKIQLHHAGKVCIDFVI